MSFSSGKRSSTSSPQDGGDSIVIGTLKGKRPNIGDIDGDDSIKSFISTPRTDAIMFSCNDILTSKIPLLLIGPSGSGKSSILCENFKRNPLFHVNSQSSNNFLRQINISEDLDSKSLYGSLGIGNNSCNINTNSDAAPDAPSTKNASGLIRWIDGPLLEAIRDGRPILLKDVHLSSPEMISLLITLIEELKGGLGFVYVGPSRTCKIGEGFLLMMTILEKSTHPSHINLLIEHLLPVKIKYPSIEECHVIFSALYCSLLPKEVLELLFSVWCTISSESKLKTLLRLTKRVNDIYIEGEGLSLELRRNILMEICDSFFGNLPLKERNLSLRPFLSLLSLSNNDEELSLVMNHPIKMSLLKNSNISIGRRIAKMQTRRSMHFLEKEIYRHGKNSSSSSSLNISSIIWTHNMALQLERIMASIVVKEPVLLIGEPGSGKTSILQYLSSLIQEKPLIVLNLNQQTEASDLLGGFRPGSLRVIGKSLAEKFSSLFSLTFPSTKNLIYQNEIKDSHNSFKWKRLVSLFYKAHKANISGILIDEWESLEDEFSSFAILLSNGGSGSGVGVGNGNLSSKPTTPLFQWMEGPLIRAIRDGHWILLDEINLATPEILDLINSLLKDGPIWLSDGASGSGSGRDAQSSSSSTLRRHPDFRLFAAMNPPSTDGAKKNLPPSISGSFCCLYCDEYDAFPEDLQLLIGTFLSGIRESSPTLIRNISLLYISWREDIRQHRIISCKGSSTSGGSKPSLSLRHLIRLLKFASKNANNSIPLKYLLKEGFEMVFLDSGLDGVVKLRDQLLLALDIDNNNCKYPLKNLPMKEGKIIMMDKYYLSKGPLEGRIDEAFILTPSVRENVSRLSRALMMDDVPILLEGPTSVGKTSLVEYMAHLTGHPFIRINNHEHTDIQEYLGAFEPRSSSIDGSPELFFKEGILVRSLREGAWVVLDELNLAPSDVLEALNRLLDDNRELFVADINETIVPSKGFRLFATQNPSGSSYGGRKALSGAFRSRFLEVPIGDLPMEEVEEIISKRCLIAPSYAKRISLVYRELQQRRSVSNLFSGKNSLITLRDLFRWAHRPIGGEVDGQAAIYTGIEQLAQNGFRVLASRLRNSDERMVVKEVLESVLKCKIDPPTLEEDSGINNDEDGIPFVGGKWISSSQSLGITWTPSMKRLFSLVWRALSNGESVLLVGDTGLGKTSVCQLIAQFLKRKLIILNCHQSTETSDFLGSLRPVTTNGEKGLFSWVDGPLVRAMRDGSFFLIDEISLAEDAVLERLNSVLEPSKTLNLAEAMSGETIIAKEGFALLATMNPGGDYGKRELSPALRNRFTEIWVPHLDLNDVPLILREKTNPALSEKIFFFIRWWKEVALISCLPLCKRWPFSMRDVLAWVDGCLQFGENLNSLIIKQCAAAIFIDPAKSISQGYGLKEVEEFTKTCKEKLDEIFSSFSADDWNIQSHISFENNSLTIGPFSLKTRNSLPSLDNIPNMNFFSFEGPTARENALRCIRAMNMGKRSVLLEGSPGVGKSSIVAALAHRTSNKLCRINLSEQTDLIDLFGAEMPKNGGGFEWKDGSFLKALKDGDWILLDELNLASQAVLEGLNACLDHRGEVFLPELNLTIHLREETRIFAAQNPVGQGGGRKGLPKSFLNRFTTVWIEAMTADDMYYIILSFLPGDSSLIRDAVTFNNEVNLTLTQGLWGKKGSPWEFNLRDLLRWVDLCLSLPTQDPRNLLSIIYLPRLRTEIDHQYMKLLLEKYNFPTSKPHWSFNGDLLSIGNLSFKPSSKVFSNKEQFLPSQIDKMEALQACISIGWPVILTGPPSSGKRSLIRMMANLHGIKVVREVTLSPNSDSSDLLGSWEQDDDANCAGLSFSFKDGPLVESLIKGYWIILRYANHCPGSVLDRLNALLEPHGSLILNESAGPDGLARIIEKHPSFRIFLTSSSAAGGGGSVELSRAMRNRGLEICVRDGTLLDRKRIIQAHHIDNCIDEDFTSLVFNKNYSSRRLAMISRLQKSSIMPINNDTNTLTMLTNDVDFDFDTNNNDDNNFWLKVQQNLETSPSNSFKDIIKWKMMIEEKLLIGQNGNILRGKDLKEYHFLNSHAILLSFSDHLSNEMEMEMDMEMENDVFFMKWENNILPLLNDFTIPTNIYDILEENNDVLNSSITKIKSINNLPMHNLGSKVFLELLSTIPLQKGSFNIFKESKETFECLTLKPKTLGDPFLRKEKISLLSKLVIVKDLVHSLRQVPHEIKEKFSTIVGFECDLYNLSSSVERLLKGDPLRCKLIPLMKSLLCVVPQNEDIILIQSRIKEILYNDKELPDGLEFLIKNQKNELQRLTSLIPSDCLSCRRIEMIKDISSFLVMVEKLLITPTPSLLENIRISLRRFLKDCSCKCSGDLVILCVCWMNILMIEVEVNSPLNLEHYNIPSISPFNKSMLHMTLHIRRSQILQEFDCGSFHFLLRKIITNIPTLTDVSNGIKSIAIEDEFEELFSKKKENNLSRLSFLIWEYLSANKRRSGDVLHSNGDNNLRSLIREPLQFLEIGEYSLRQTIDSLFFEKNINDSNDAMWEEISSCLTWIQMSILNPLLQEHPEHDLLLRIDEEINRMFLISISSLNEGFDDSLEKVMNHLEHLMETINEWEKHCSRGRMSFSKGIDKILAIMIKKRGMEVREFAKIIERIDEKYLYSSLLISQNKKENTENIENNASPPTIFWLLDLLMMERDGSSDDIKVIEMIEMFLLGCPLGEFVARLNLLSQLDGRLMKGMIGFTILPKICSYWNSLFSKRLSKLVKDHKDGVLRDLKASLIGLNWNLVGGEGRSDSSLLLKGYLAIKDQFLKLKNVLSKHITKYRELMDQPVSLIMSRSLNKGYLLGNYRESSEEVSFNTKEDDSNIKETKYYTTNSKLVLEAQRRLKDVREKLCYDSLVLNDLSSIIWKSVNDLSSMKATSTVVEEREKENTHIYQMKRESLILLFKVMKGPLGVKIQYGVPPKLSSPTQIIANQESIPPFNKNLEYWANSLACWQAIQDPTSLIHKDIGINEVGLLRGMIWRLLDSSNRISKLFLKVNLTIHPSAPLLENGSNVFVVFKGEKVSIFRSLLQNILIESSKSSLQIEAHPDCEEEKIYLEQYKSLSQTILEDISTFTSFEDLIFTTPLRWDIIKDNYSLLVKNHIPYKTISISLQDLLNNIPAILSSLDCHLPVPEEVMSLEAITCGSLCLLIQEIESFSKKKEIFEREVQFSIPIHKEGFIEALIVGIEESLKLTEKIAKILSISFRRYILSPTSPSNEVLELLNTLNIFLTSFKEDLILQQRSLHKLTMILGSIVQRILKDGFCRPPPEKEEKDFNGDDNCNQDDKENDDPSGMADISKEDKMDENTKNIGDEMEFEEQITDLMNDADNDDDPGDTEKTEKGDNDSSIEMSDEFNSKDDYKEESHSDNEEEDDKEQPLEKEEEEEQIDKQMGDTSPSAENEELDSLWPKEDEKINDEKINDEKINDEKDDDSLENKDQQENKNSKKTSELVANENEEESRNDTSDNEMEEDSSLSPNDLDLKDDVDNDVEMKEDKEDIDLDDDQPKDDEDQNNNDMNEDQNDDINDSSNIHTEDIEDDNTEDFEDGNTKDDNDIEEEEEEEEEDGMSNNHNQEDHSKEKTENNNENFDNTKGLNGQNEEDSSGNNENEENSSSSSMATSSNRQNDEQSSTNQSSTNRESSLRNPSKNNENFSPIERKGRTKKMILEENDDDDDDDILCDKDSIGNDSEQQYREDNTSNTEIIGKSADTDEKKAIDDSDSTPISATSDDESPNHTTPDDMIIDEEISEQYMNNKNNNNNNHTIKEDGEEEDGENIKEDIRSIPNWSDVQSRTLDLSRDLCEQLRLIMVATKATKMSGEFKSGKRLNLRKIPSYIASNYRKDKIWMRRNKPSKREYRVSISIDNSQSMWDGSAALLAIDALGIISGALNLLEVGKISVNAFGSCVNELHSFEDHWNDESGQKVLNELKFVEKETNVLKLLRRIIDEYDSSSLKDDISDFQLNLILSDGIFNEEDIESDGVNGSIRSLISESLENKIINVFVILDKSVLGINKVSYKEDGCIQMTKYLETFPFQYYVVVEDLALLPNILSDTIRQWFELISMM